MGLREDTTVSNTGSIHRPGAPTKRKMTMSRLLSLSLPASGSRTLVGRHSGALANEQGPLLPYLFTYLPPIDTRVPNHACKLPHLE